jgi:pimeloyl-ACP methyl ester carboxylesterase
MNGQGQSAAHGRRRKARSIESSVHASPREQVLSWIPLVERHLSLAGILTAVLEGGEGPPVILLHGPSGYAAHWMRIIPDLASTHHIIAPDLPGHGASEFDRSVDGNRVLAWLGELIDKTCSSPPALVGQLLGGAIAARFAARRGNQVSRLVLVDTFGLSPFRPAPDFAQALADFLDGPCEHTHRNLWRYCAFDFDRVRERMGARWQPFEAYNLDRARRIGATANVSTLMAEIGIPAIPRAELERIAVPTALIWGRHDLATPLSIAEAASKQYGWPLHVIDGAADAPDLEQPEAFLLALRAALACERSASDGKKS